MAESDYDRAAARIKDNPDEAMLVGPRSSELVNRAEERLGLRFPPAYRRFLLEFGAGGFAGIDLYGVVGTDFDNSSVPDAIWYTINERKDGLPNQFVVVGVDGLGGLYCLDCGNGEGYGAVVLMYPEFGDANPGEVAYSDYGAFLRYATENAP